MKAGFFAEEEQQESSSEPEPEEEAEETDLQSFLDSIAAADTTGGRNRSLPWDAASFGEAVREGFSQMYSGVADEAASAGSDVVVRVGGEKLFCHSVVLSACSATLRASLDDRWSGAESKIAAPEITVESASASDFKALLEFMYTGTTTLTPSNVLGVLQLSDFYSVLPMKQACGDVLFDLLGKDQLPALLGLAEEYRVKQLRVRCAAVLANDFEDMLDMGTLWELSVEVWTELLAQTELAVSDETAVLDAVLEYAKRAAGGDMQGTRGAAVLEALLPLVRMPQLGERLMAVEGDGALMAIPGVSAQVAAAFRSLAFPTATIDPVQATQRVGLSSFDTRYTHEAIEVSLRDRIASFPSAQDTTAAYQAQAAVGAQYGPAAVVQPAVESGRWVLSIDSVGNVPAPGAGLGGAAAGGFAHLVWVCTEDAVSQMTPKASSFMPNNYVLFSNGQISNSQGQAVHVGSFADGDVMAVELDKDGQVQFFKNGSALGDKLSAQAGGSSHSAAKYVLVITGTPGHAAPGQQPPPSECVVRLLNPREGQAQSTSDEEDATATLRPRTVR